MTQSSEIKELITALARARLEMKPPAKTERHAQFGYYYSNCDDIIAATLEPLAKNGITILIAQDDTHDGRYLVYSLAHVSGQFYGGRSLVCKADVSSQDYRKALGWKLTEIYQLLTGVTGIVGQAEEKAEEVFAKHDEPISDKQLSLLMHKIGSRPQLVQNILKKYKIQDLSEIKRKDFNVILEVC